ncbi:MAG TPA: glycosyltransferase [Pyrinomonadaceae bacterium]|jgi:cellulose synthase/poly-beta-1,6-N-acetylglucosamine synthase-like glycosyltransferase
MIFVFYLFAALLVFMSWKSFRGGIDYLNFFKNELARPKSDYTPFVSIIAPCRGLDEDLEKNLSALFRQDFPLYEIIFAVDDPDDASVPVIKKLLAVYASIPAKLIVAPDSVDNSQKVENLREAVLHASKKSQIFVFVDSDARPAANWLRDLIAPLASEKIGAATAYRWFISKKMNFASEMRSVWNASIASALGANLETNFCWGGSMAVRRETFENLELRERWRGTLSDDFTVTRAMKKAELPIYFVPQALAASIENCTFRELLEFTTRQIKITRVYSPNLWAQAFAGSFIFNLVLVWGIFILIFRPIGEFSFWFALVALILISAFSTGKAHLRLKAVRLVLKDYETELNKQFWTQNTLWILSPALFFYNGFRALLSRKIVWRGIKYELKSPNQTSIIAAKK